MLDPEAANNHLRKLEDYLKENILQLTKDYVNK